MSDRDDLPKRGIPFYAMIDETGIAVGGTSTQSILRGKDMEPICATDSSGVSNGVTANTLRQRGINFFCPVLETGLAADATTMNTLGQRGIPLFCAVSNVGVAQGGTLTIGQLAQRGIPYFCPLDENGTATTLGVLPTTPVLAITSLSTDNTPEFTIDFDDTVAAGDNMRLQVQVSGGDWSSLVSDTNHIITAPEDTANEVDLALTALGNANYDARANVTHGATSAWSNTVTFTISVVSTATTYYILGF